MGEWACCRRWGGGPMVSGHIFWGGSGLYKGDKGLASGMSMQPRGKGVVTVPEVPCRVPPRGWLYRV